MTKERTSSNSSLAAETAPVAHEPGGEIIGQFGTFNAPPSAARARSGENTITDGASGTSVSGDILDREHAAVAESDFGGFHAPWDRTAHGAHDSNYFDGGV